MGISGDVRKEIWDDGNDHDIEKKLLSVIVPVYNVEPYLRRCLDSICNQSYRELEILCVNDGSTDNSLIILQEYAEKDSRIQVITKENGGLVSARKAGILRASGEYVTYVDSDDWIEQGMYEHLIELAVKEDADIVTSGDIRDYGTHRVEEPEHAETGIYQDRRILQLKENLIDTTVFFRKNISFHLIDKIFKRKYLLEYQLRISNQVNVGEDVAVAYPAIMNAKKIVVSGRNYYHYCLRNDSIMGIHRNDDLKSIKIMLNQLEGDLKDVSSSVINAVQQYKMLFLYVNLLRNLRNVIKFNNNFLYPFGNIPRNSKVIIYGAGKFGTELKSFIEEQSYLKLSAVLDKMPGPDQLHPSEIQNIQYDYVLIAALVYDVIEEMRRELRIYGVKDSQVLYVKADLL